MNKLSALVVCLMVCALFGLTFGQENDFRETTGTKKRDLPLNPETVKPCLDSTRFGSFFTVSSSYRGPKSLAAADFTGDGRQDVVAAASTDNQVVLFRNDDTSRWTSITLGTVNGASAVFAADLNADSRVDVVATSETDNTVYWFQNLGGNKWAQRTIATTAGAAPTSVFVADINGDNKLDVIMAGDLLVYVENQITNANMDGWTQHTVDYTGGHIDSVYAADINKDSFIDLVIASSVDNSIAWLNNTNGLGTAFVSIPIATPTGPVQVFCGDMDNDTWVDVVAVNKGENATALYYNSLVTNHTLPAGNNNSAAAESGWVGVYVNKQQNAPESVFLADLNGDGLQDIIVAESGNNTVQWYDSADDYTWTAGTVGSLTNPTYVVARDIDNSNAKDVIVASENKHTVGWFKELCATSPPSSGDDDHVVGWAVVGGVVGGLLILWILIAIVIAIRDYIKHQMDKATEQRKREAKAMLPATHEDL